jgi:hypothetical protein
MFMTGEIVHSCASLSPVSLRLRRVEIRTRKFSVNSPERPTTMKMKAIPTKSDQAK